MNNTEQSFYEKPFFTDMLKKLISKIPSWLRWIIVLPLSLILAYVVWFICQILIKMSLPCATSEILFTNITLLEFAQILDNGLFCWCFLYYSHIIAPHHKNETLIVLAFISSIFISAPIVMELIHGSYHFFSVVVLSDIVYIGTAAYACCKVPNLFPSKNKPTNDEFIIPKVQHIEDDNNEIIKTEAIKNKLRNISQDKIEYFYEDEEEGKVAIPKSFFDIKLNNTKNISEEYDEIKNETTYTFVSSGNTYKVVVKE